MMTKHLSHMHSTFTFSLPDWLKEFDFQSYYPDNESKIRLAYALVEKNIYHDSGGPFSAIAFDREGRVVQAAVNQVVPADSSVLHAEMALTMLTQQSLASFTLADKELTMVASSQPCIQCFGSLFWSGFERLVYGTSAQDVEELTGFIEGPVPIDWKDKLRSRHVQVEGPYLQQEGRALLARYAEEGPIYNK